MLSFEADAGVAFFLADVFFCLLAVFLRWSSFFPPDFELERPALELLACLEPPFFDELRAFALVAGLDEPPPFC